MASVRADSAFNTEMLRRADQLVRLEIEDRPTKVRPIVVSGVTDAASAQEPQARVKPSDKAVKQAGRSHECAA